MVRTDTDTVSESPPSERSLSETAMYRGLPGLRIAAIAFAPEVCPSPTIASICASASLSSVRGAPAPIASRASSTTRSFFGSPSGSPRAFRNSGSIAYEATSLPQTSSTVFDGAALPSRTSTSPLKMLGSRAEG